MEWINKESVLRICEAESEDVAAIISKVKRLPIKCISEWISVSDRLPERKQDVLMYFDTGNMAVGFWYDGDETITFWSAYTDDGWYADCDCEPLYWMPLPPAPKEDARKNT